MSAAGQQIYDVIVVGAGHNGLTAAAYLARAGLRTLVLERREIVGGCCVTEEIAPECRASRTSYIASMLRPTVIRDLNLGAHGLRMVPCDPSILVAFPDDTVLPWWAERERALQEFRKISVRDAETFARVDDKLKKLARYLQPFFLEPPPQVGSHGIGGWMELLRAGRRFRGISGEEIAEFVSFFTGSLGEFLDRNYETEKMKTLILANNVYGKHGGPYDNGSALGLLFHLLSGGDGEIQGFYGHVIGGMGSITQALAAAARKFGAEIRVSAPVARIDTRNGRARGVTLEDGTEIRAKLVLSNADPKRTFLQLVESSELNAEFRRAIGGIKMAGPCAKVNFVLSEEPRVKGVPRDWPAPQRSLHERLFAGLGVAPRRRRESARPRGRGWIARRLRMWTIRLAPAGKYIMTCSVQYVPTSCAMEIGTQQRESSGDRVVKIIGRYVLNVPGAILARAVFHAAGSSSALMDCRRGTFFTATFRWSSFPRCGRRRVGRVIACLLLGLFVRGWRGIRAGELPARRDITRRSRVLRDLRRGMGLS